MALRTDPVEREEQLRRYRQKYRDNGMMKEWQNKHRYGLTTGQRAEMERQQDYKCAACGLPFGDRVTAIDHDHETKVVRGIVHRQCNSMMGLANDDPAILEAAAAYLRKQKEMA